MGQYEPNDSRDVTLNANAAPGEPPRTGPRESDTRKQDEDSAKAGSAYGNSRDKDGQREADMAEDKKNGESESAGEPTADAVGETSDEPNVRARADANPPLI